MDLATVTFEVDRGIARVVLNRPAQLNAISPTLLEDLDRVCDEVERSPAVRAMTLTAAGRAFCAGADLKAVRELSPDPVKWNEFMRLWHRVFNRLEALPVPVVAGVHGFASPAASSWRSSSIWSWPMSLLGSAISTPISASSRAGAAASVSRV